MTNTRYRIIELSLIAVLLAFIVGVCIFYSGGTKKSIDDITPPVEAVLKDSTMKKKANADALKAFGFDMTKTDGVAYYAADNVMDVSEVLIIKLKDKENAPEFKDAITARVTNQKNLYKNYAPKQYALLKNCIIESSGNVVFYCTATNADAIYDAYYDVL